MKDVRKKRVEVRFNQSEWDCLAVAADKKDLTVSAYIRKLVLEKCQKK